MFACTSRPIPHSNSTRKKIQHNRKPSNPACLADDPLKLVGFYFLFFDWFSLATMCIERQHYFCTIIIIIHSHTHTHAHTHTHSRLLARRPRRRVSSDNIGVVTHSSPVLLYESPKCVGMKIEDTPASKITQCPMAGTKCDVLRSLSHRLHVPLIDCL